MGAAQEERIRTLVGRTHTLDADLVASHKDAADARNARDAALSKYADMKSATQGLVKVCVRVCVYGCVFTLSLTCVHVCLLQNWLALM
jgi:hypothetical protein